MFSQLGCPFRVEIQASILARSVSQPLPARRYNLSVLMNSSKAADDSKQARYRVETHSLDLNQEEAELCSTSLPAQSKSASRRSTATRCDEHLRSRVEQEQRKEHAAAAALSFFMICPSGAAKVRPTPR